MNMKITMLMAVTADGKIARNSSHFPDWTSKEDKKVFFLDNGDHARRRCGSRHRVIVCSSSVSEQLRRRDTENRRFVALATSD